MNGLLLAALLGVALLVGGVVSQRTRLPEPLVLLVLGIAIGYLPPFGAIRLAPEVVLTLFLPALLYWESIKTSTREARRNARVILLSAIPLVILTAALVAGVGHLAGLGWAVAITLGAVVAPTDATAISPTVRGLPRRVRTVLQTESLINDGTALTIYAIATAAVGAHREIDFGFGTLLFLGAYAGGIAIGVAVAYVVRAARRLVRGTPLLENTVSVLTPFLAYLPAERLHVSGVVAVVTCGLISTHFGPRAISVQARVQAQGFWELASSLVNGALFLLVGLQANQILQRLDGETPRVLGLGLVIALVVVVARIAWVNTVPYLIRALDRRPVQRTMRVNARQRQVSGWAGMRGAVSLAAALALGEEFPQYSELLAITLVVIVFTLAVQGLTMPLVVRFARMPLDRSEQEEEALAQRTMSDTAGAALEPLIERLQIDEAAADTVRRQYEEIHRTGGGWASLGQGSEGDLRRALIGKKRESVIRLRDRGEIDDTVLRRMQDRLDIEELRLSPVRADD